MTDAWRIALAGAVFALVAGCATLEPELPVADAAVPAEWPLPPTTSGALAAPVGETMPAAAAVADIGWRDFFVDPRLAELIGRALANNRDLRVSMLDVERARALYRIQRAGLWPSASIDAAASRGGGNRAQPDIYSVGVGAAWELDFFGRVRSLNDAALQRYFALDNARRSAQLSLISEIANAWLTLAADREALRVAQAALGNRQEALALTERRHEYGAVSGLDLSQAQTSVETARTDASRFAGLAAQDLNALTLLVGAPIEESLLPTRFDVQASGIGALPSGLPSEVLLRRPDVMQAEHLLRAANANIGAARAAFFPSISLTASLGTASNELSGLFGAGSRFWTFVPQASLPIFQAGRLRANLAVAQADRDIALASYERSIQSGFREVSDALALTRTLAEQKESQRALVAAAQNAEELSRARYEAGRDSYLVLLDAQRTLYLAQQSLVATQLAEQVNRVALYKVLGGGWYERNR